MIGCLRLRTRLRSGRPPVGAFLGARVWYGYPIPPKLSDSSGYQHEQPTSTGHHSRTGLLFARSTPLSDLRHVARHGCATCRFRPMSELGMNPSWPASREAHMLGFRSELNLRTCGEAKPQVALGTA